jgi:hypothetical protein
LKRFRLSVALAVVVILTLLLAVPTQAGITSHNYIDPVYEGWDDFLSASVAAYTAGDNATVVAYLENGVGEDITLQAGNLRMDWGDVFPATDFPDTLPEDEAAVMTFEFEVPDSAAASPLVTHQWEIVVEWSPEEIDSAADDYVDEPVWGGASDQLPDIPVVPGSVTLYDDGSEIADSAYTVDYETGVITWSTAPAGTVTADFRTMEDLGNGNGDRTEFNLPHTYVVASTLVVCKDGVEVASSEYTVDREDGTITFDTAPANGEDISAEYDYYQTWTREWDDDFMNKYFAIYTTPQTDGTDLKDQLDAFDYEDLFGAMYGAPAVTRDLLAQSAEQEALGDQAYLAGNFSAARAHYQSALSLRDQAIEADTDLVKNDLNLPSVGVWILAIGLLLFGLGVLVFALRWHTP